MGGRGESFAIYARDNDHSRPPVEDSEAAKYADSEFGPVPELLRKDWWPADTQRLSQERWVHVHERHDPFVGADLKNRFLPGTNIEEAIYDTMIKNDWHYDATGGRVYAHETQGQLVRVITRYRYGQDSWFITAVQPVR